MTTGDPSPLARPHELTKAEWKEIAEEPAESETDMDDDKVAAPEAGREPITAERTARLMFPDEPLRWPGAVLILEAYAESHLSVVEALRDVMCGKEDSLDRARAILRNFPLEPKP